MDDMINGVLHVDDGSFDSRNVFLLSGEGGFNGVNGGLLAHDGFMEFMDGFVDGAVVGGGFGYGLH